MYVLSVGFITTEKQHARPETRNAGLAVKRTTSSVCYTTVKGNTNQVQYVSEMRTAISSSTSAYFFGSINQQNMDQRVNFKINIGEVGNSVQCNPTKLRQRTMQRYAMSVLRDESQFLFCRRWTGTSSAWCATHSGVTARTPPSTDWCSPMYQW